MRYLILGNPRVLDEKGDAVVVSSSGKRQAVLTALLLQPGASRNAWQLMPYLWDDPPASAAANVRSHITGLRQDLEAARTGLNQRLRTRSAGGGYLLDVESHEVDLHVFTSRAQAGRTALRHRDLSDAIRKLESALCLWREPLGAGLPSTRRLEGLATGLAQARLDTCQDLYTAYLLRGETGMLTYRIETTLAEAPHRERLWELLVAAQFQVGDVGGALVTVGRCRSLFDELGLGLPDRMNDLHRAVLLRDAQEVHGLFRF